MSRPLILSLAVVAFSLAAPLGSASAGPIDPSRSTIGNTAQLNANATSVQLGGVVHCALCRRFTLGATVSQTASGAVAQGGVRCVCHGATQRWLVTARARERTRFRAGAARICVWIIARGASGKAIDAQQWCESVTLRADET